jgi:hypothetical protein
MRQRAASNGAFTCGKVGFCSKLAQSLSKCDKGPQVMAHSLAEKSDFRAIFIKNATKGRKQWRIHLQKSRIFAQSLSKMRQRAASNGAFTCGKVGFSRNLYQKCDKGPQVIAHLLAEKSHFVQNLRNLYQNATRPQVMAQLLAEKSDFVQNSRNYLRIHFWKSRILNKTLSKMRQGRK